MEPITPRQLSYLGALVHEMLVMTDVLVEGKVAGSAEFFKTAQAADEAVRGHIEAKTFSKANASQAIDYIISVNGKIRKALKDAGVRIPSKSDIDGRVASTEKPAAAEGSSAFKAPAPKARHSVTEDGMYKLGDDIYKVQWNISKTGLYAKKLVIDQPAVWDFVPGGEETDGEPVSVIVQAAEVSFHYDASAVRRLAAEDKMSFDEAKEFGALYGTCCRCGRTLTDDSKGGSIEQGIGPICAGKFS